MQWQTRSENNQPLAGSDRPGLIYVFRRIRQETTEKTEAEGGARESRIEWGHKRKKKASDEQVDKAARKPQESEESERDRTLTQCRALRLLRAVLAIRFHDNAGMLGGRQSSGVPLQYGIQGCSSPTRLGRVGNSKAVPGFFWSGRGTRPNREGRLERQDTDGGIQIEWKRKINDVDQGIGI